MTTPNHAGEMIRLEEDGDIAILTVDAPPVNALSRVVRAGIIGAIRTLSARPHRPRAVALTCAGRTFFAGADITEIGKGPQPPEFPEMLETVENAPFPVVAAIHGTALGGGLELALACHHRVAVDDARLGLPEVRLGLLPGAGGTQRLPRLIGVRPALDIMISGEPVSASRALALGLIDASGPQEARALGVAFAAGIAPAAGLRRVRDLGEHLEAARAEPALFETWRAANARRFRGQDAPGHILRCVEAAVTLPFDAGLAVERQLFTELEQGPQSAALRHVFFAERLAMRPSVIRDAPVAPIARAGVLGAGTMGRGIALALAAAGVAVTIADAAPGAAVTAVEAMAASLRGSASRGRFSGAEAEARIARLHAAATVADLADSDLVVEAVYEDMAVKKAVFAELDRVVQPRAILASNTSYLDIDAIAAATARPAQVLGMHFFSPANIMRLVEVVRGAATAPQTLATAFALVRRMDKLPVLTGVCHGFIGNRMLELRQDEAVRLVLEGATPAQVDAVMTGFGLPMGPFAMHDLAGLDLGWSAETSRGETLRDILCEAGRRGQKTGAGYFDYTPDRKPVVSPEVEAMIRDFAARHGHAGPAPEPSEILDRLVLPMIDEGARILAEGMAERASDIDLVWINGYGWPAVTGGPMFWVVAQGLEAIVGRLDRLALRHGARFAPSPPLRQAAARGGWA